MPLWGSSTSCSPSSMALAKPRRGLPTYEHAVRALVTPALENHARIDAEEQREHDERQRHREPRFFG